MEVMVTTFVFMVLAQIMPGIKIRSTGSALVSALIYSLLTLFVRPILEILFLPVTILTLGLMHWLIGGMVLYMTSRLTSGVQIRSYGTALIVSLIIAIAHSFVH